MLLNLAPLIRHRDFRFLYIGQFISFFGSMLTYVALPYQVFQLTHSSLAVGMIGVVQLVPLVFTGLIGGALADAMDRRRLLIISELVLSLCMLILALNAIVSRPHVWLIYAVAALASAVNGFHRPAMDAMMPKLINPDDIPDLGPLNSLRSAVGMIAGPALGGVLLSVAGVSIIYWVDFFSFGISLLALACISSMPALNPASSVGAAKIMEGLKYAWSRQELIGTYLVDFVAMVFGMPMALFPEVAESFGGAKVVGWLYTAPSVGAFIATVFSGWTKKVRRQGAAVAVAAGIWGLAITAFGFSRNLWLSLFLLGLAGAADMVSGIFRSTIWNSTIPDSMRGRLASIEMLSYTSGPLLGNAESGLVAAFANTQVSIVSGGALCIVGVFVCVLRLPSFWGYTFKE